jgi:Glycosyl hydrolases family 35
MKATTLLSLVILFVLGGSGHAAQKRVQLTDNHLVVDGRPVPFLFGAEVQYFRARGGGSKKVPKATVLALWNRLLDRVQEAHMNAVTLYLPWDFHEPREGTFHFDGDVDYPSRDLRTFLKMVEARGIRYVMVRPGPYINAEWGPTGFGAIPLWFLDNYPQALTGTLTPGKPRTVTFAHPDYQSHVRIWFRELYQNVLKDFMGPGKPVVLLQLDNETNYFWDSVYQRDLSPLAKARYREFLKNSYGEIDALSKAYHTTLSSFDDIEPPSGENDMRYPSGLWHYDWFHFHDVEVRSYYEFIKEAWRDAGLPEDQILWTSCESFNAFHSGLLPRLDYRGQNDSLTTLNIYPKTVDVPATLATPMKGAHDAALLASSHRQFYGTGGNWLMSTETVGGWFAPAKITWATRQHTYSSLMGAGVKALSIYYFHEGYNWSGLEGEDSELHFDAPLDKDMNARESFRLLKEVGAALQGGLGDELMDSDLVTSPVLIAHDAGGQYPWPGAKVDAVSASAEESSALYGILREAGTVPEVQFLNGLSPNELQRYRLVVWNHPGYVSAEVHEKLKGYVAAGGHLVVIGDPVKDLPESAKVTYFAKNPFVIWNTPEYTTQANASELLRQVANLLTKSGIQPAIRWTTSDGQPFVQASIRRSRTTKRDLLFVENFLAKTRSLKLSWNQSLTSSGEKVHLKRVMGTPSEEVSSCVEPQKGFQLPVSSDAVDIWEVTPCP